MDLHSVEAYLRPNSLEAVTEWNIGWAWLAGGTWLFSEPQPQITTLVDLEPLNWSEIEVTQDAIAIGATCSFLQLQKYEWRTEWQAIAALKGAINALAASFKVTNSATIGGNICLALAIGVMAPLMVALDATYEIWHSSGAVRFVPANEFQTGTRQTVLQPGEGLRRIWILQTTLRSPATFQRIGVAATDPALSLVAGWFDLQTGQVRFGLGACFPAARSLTFSHLPTRKQIGEALQDASLPWLEDFRASALYRQQVTKVLIERSVQQLSNANSVSNTNRLPSP